MEITLEKVHKRLLRIQNLVYNNNGETWHKLTPSLTGWTNQTSGTNLQYKMVAINQVAITAELFSSGSGVAGVLATLPAGYRPNGVQFIPFWLGSGATTNSHCQVNTDGTLNITAGPTSGVYWLSGSIYLDTI